MHLSFSFGTVRAVLLHGAPGEEREGMMHPAGGMVHPPLHRTPGAGQPPMAISN